MDGLTLLREYARRDSEAAFAKLVARRMNPAHPPALRPAHGFHIAHQFVLPLKTSAVPPGLWVAVCKHPAS